LTQNNSLDIFQSLAPSPLEELNCPLFIEKGLKVFVKRDDLIHPSVQGNKWRKLKYNILKIKDLGISKMLTYGGAFSNHIYATAAAGKLLGIDTIGIIRGERSYPLSKTLVFAENCGMSLVFVSRTDFKNKDAIAKTITENTVSDIYLLPEGGTNTLALLGCQEIVKEVNQQVPFAVDYIITACGTGGTISGIIQSVNENQEVVGISVLKGNFLKNDIANLININDNIYISDTEKNINSEKKSKWTLNTDYHFGGYAKWTVELIEFMNQFKIQFGIPLDPVYTSKMFYGLFDLIKKDYFPRGSTIVAIHTGGLQGIEGFNEVRLKNSPIKII
jgi:1-aminocyclopropane-1-carboxylate deaminase